MNQYRNMQFFENVSSGNLTFPAIIGFGGGSHVTLSTEAVIVGSIGGSILLLCGCAVLFALCMSTCRLVTCLDDGQGDVLLKQRKGRQERMKEEQDNRSDENE